MGWAYLEQGRWADVRAVAAEVAAVASAAGLDHAEACAQALEAMVLALLGDPAAASSSRSITRRAAERALVLVDPRESRSVTVNAQRTLGLAALAEGDHDTVGARFRSAFTDSGDPVHHHVSHTVLADLATTAVRRGSGEDAAGVLDEAAGHLANGGSARLTALLHRGRALLAAPDRAEHQFPAALAGVVVGAVAF